MIKTGVCDDIINPVGTIQGILSVAMRMINEPSLELSIVMPCLNEEGAVGSCVRDALGYISGKGLSGEVVVVDNGSTDNSRTEAEEAGAVVYREEVRGYGSALRKGISVSKGNVIIFGDCDTTYDFKDLTGFYEPLSNGTYDVMIGDRLSGISEDGSMQLSHILGVKFLSAYARKRFSTDVRDFHCGLRGLTREAAEQMDMKTDGMEFATEFIAVASKCGLKIGQTDICLKKSIGQRRSKLNPVRDGFRHLRFISRGC